MGYEGSPVKATPYTRRRMLPPTPQQISHSSPDESRSWKRKASGAFRKEGFWRQWKNYLDKSDDIKVEIKALELLMDPDDSEVYPGACKKKRQQDLRDVQHKEKTDNLVASRNRWMEHEGQRVALQERCRCRS